jgi:hypothetical protein
MTRPRKYRICIAVLISMGLAIWCIFIHSLRKIALFKSELSAYFFGWNQRTERAIVVAQDPTLAWVFPLLSVSLLVLGLFLLLGSRLPVYLVILLISLLFIPCLWYTQELAFLSGKLVAWDQVLHDSTPETRQAP